MGSDPALTSKIVGPLRNPKTQITVLHTDSPDDSENEEETSNMKVTNQNNRSQIVDYRGMKMTLT